MGFSPALDSGIPLPRGASCAHHHSNVAGLPQDSGSTPHACCLGWLLSHRLSFSTWLQTNTCIEILKLIHYIRWKSSLDVFGSERSPQSAAEAHEKPANLFFKKERCPYGNVRPPSSLPFRTPHLQLLWLSFTWLFIFTSLNNQWKVWYYRNMNMVRILSTTQLTAAPGSWPPKRLDLTFWTCLSNEEANFQPNHTHPSEQCP